MAKPFDATTKHLVESRPENWLEYLGLRFSGSVEVLNVELSTITAEADQVLRVNDPTPWLAQIEFQASYDRTLARRLLRYSVLLAARHEVPVHSVVVLLRREADGPALTGVLEDRLPGADAAYLSFRYQVVRVWQQPVAALLAGGLSTLPLAPLADVTPAQLPAVIRRMAERLSQEASPSEAATLWTATYVLMGLRYEREVARNLLRGVMTMRESVTYQAILMEGEAEGRTSEARRLLVLQGTRRFGPPSDETRAAIERITDLDQLEGLGLRLLDVGSWEELLAGR